MDSLNDSHEDSPKSLTAVHGVKVEKEEFASQTYETLQNVTDLKADGSGFTFTPLMVKEEDTNIIKNEFHPTTLRFQNANIPVISGSNSPLKVNSSNVIHGTVPIASQAMQIASSNVQINSNDTSSVMSLGTAIQTCMPISQDPGKTVNSQNVPIFSSSLENCNAVLSQSQTPSQTFILASNDNVMAASNTSSQGQVFLQGNELLGVNLSSASSNSSYTISNSEAQYINQIPIMLSSTQAMGSSLSRLLIHPNQTSATGLNNQILSANNGQYVLQMEPTSFTPTTQTSKLSLNNKGHIVIKAGSSRVKNLSAVTPVKEGVLRVVIPEGTTKLPKLTYPIQSVPDNENTIQKHVQINLLSTEAMQANQSLNQLVKNPGLPNDNTHFMNKKLYECSHCNNKFMKPLYLRMHMRSCKKPEASSEKTPLLMCAFCKGVFQTKAIIDSHIVKCAQRPSKNDNLDKSSVDSRESKTSGRRSKVVDHSLSLESAVLYKCQDCDRTFSKERQYSSHIKRCTKVSVHDMSGVKVDSSVVNTVEENDPLALEDPFADPPLPNPPSKRSRGGSGRRGRPPGRLTSNLQKVSSHADVLFEGDKVLGSTKGLMVADNNNVVRSTVGLAHTVQLSLETSKANGQPFPSALVADLKGVRPRDQLPHAWSLVCSLCQKMFLTKASLASHVIEAHGRDLNTTKNVMAGQAAEGEKLLCCPLCHLHFRTSDFFLEHLLIQHTSQLQEKYRSLQRQTATFVCSLCSLVLLTKNMLMEHLSLEHLDHLEKLYQTTLSTQRKKAMQLQSATPIPANGVLSSKSTSVEPPCSTLDQASLSSSQDRGSVICMKPNKDGKLDCSLCCDDFPNSFTLFQHLKRSHDIDVDSEGVVTDSGFDVDVRVKNTNDLLHLADGKEPSTDESLPSKTVLLRKKPRQSWQCQSCSQEFTKQMNWLQHMREECLSSQSNTKDSSKAASTSSSRESHFFCHEASCNQIAFYQVKSLFKHLEEAHNIVVRKQRMSFPNLSMFLTWLQAEEDKKGVRFIRDNSRLEKTNFRLIQMVCHRFHSAKLEQMKERDDGDLMKPTKKRWTSRARNTDYCHARIHLRIELSSSSREFDGTTQIIYYPDHHHTGEEDTLDVLESIRLKFPRDRLLGSSSVAPRSTSTFTSTSDLILGLSNDSFDNPHTPRRDEATSIDPPPHSSSHQFLKEGNVGILKRNTKPVSFPLQMASLVVPGNNATNSTHAVLLSSPPSSSTVASASTAKASLMFGAEMSEPDEAMLPSSPGGGGSRFLVMNSGEAREAEEYVLPADESEWKKLFNVLSEKISSGELSDVEMKDSESLLGYQSLLPVLSISEQVIIFQKLCSITQTSLESV